MKQHKVVFLPDRRSSLFDEGTSLRDAALELGIVIESSCAGIGTCGECRVHVTAGAATPTSTELDILSPSEIGQGIRLSCQAEIVGDCTCTILPESRVRGDQILEHGQGGAFRLEPDCVKRVLSVPGPGLGRKYFDLDALVHAAGQVVDVTAPPDLALIRRIPEVLRANNHEVTAVFDQGRLLSVEPGDTSSRIFGVAVDIGTTTVVAKLIDLLTGDVQGVMSALNAQGTRGADVITRVKFVMENPNGLETLNRLVINQINSLVGELCRKADVREQEVYKMVLAGNTVMQHLALGVDPRHLAEAPYTPALQGPVTAKASDLGLSINQDGVAYFLPNLACFVGSDITSVLTTLDFEESEELQLVVDIGTNGETVLGNRDRLLCCSSPAGPAWEGASISWGMRAAHAAIERVELSGGSLVWRTIGNLPPVGICGSGLMDLLALLVRTGVVDSTGRILAPEQIASCAPALADRVVSNHNGGFAFRLALTESGAWVELTQRDVRELQLAKSAILSAINMMLSKLGVKASDLSKLLIAGAFGNHIRGRDAIDVGLLPPVPADRIHFIGNAAVAGAEAILCSEAARRKAERLAAQVEYVELAGKPEFQEEFASGLLFPEH